MKGDSAKLRALRADLAYFQEQARTEARWLALSQEKCTAIENAIRELQARQKPPATSSHRQKGR